MFGTALNLTERFTVRGVKLEIPRYLLTDRIRAAMKEGWYEGHEAAELDHLIQDGDVVLEIGAGVGLISTLAKLNPKTQRVYAVEADPRLIPIIARTHALNGVDVTIYNEILGPSSGEAQFTIHDDFWASSAGGTNGKSIAVPMTSFQDRLDEIKPTFIIADIEGGELSLFDGVDLTGVNKIMIEVHQYVLGRKGMKHLFDTLSRQNFHYDQWHSSRAIVTFSHVDRI